MNMNRRHFLTGSASLAAAMAASCMVPQAARADDRPNVLFILSDDQQHDTIHALGNNAIQTPNIDSLARNGVAFRNTYIMGASSPGVCSPSRACLLTGRTLWNIENQDIWGYEMSEQFKTLPEVFRENGYVTFATGKNHPGISGQFHRAYSEGDKLLFSGTSASKFRQFLYPFSPEGIYDKKSRIQYKGTHSTKVYADACISFLKRHESSTQPFYAYVAFQAPHDPRESPAEFRERYKNEDMRLPAAFMPQHPFPSGTDRDWDEKRVKWPRTESDIRKHIADYYALITTMDEQIGRILETLKETGKYENTIIVFASDNGLALGRHGLVGKQNIYEHSVRVPLIISGPGIARGETRDQLCYLFDINPTLCELASLPVPGTVQSKSLKPVLSDAKAPHRDHLYFAYMNWQRAVRDERYKLIEYCVEDERQTQFFDLADDPHELRNLAQDPNHAPALQALRALLKQERVRLNDGNTPYAFADEQGKYFWARFND
ncbi:MAG: sulfatase-like hydrolase/transferase [Lentisphaeria bacterium]|nr:sulfatase-like hydrolase/transferase [Lentisphaeria bacterium]